MEGVGDSYIGEYGWLIGGSIEDPGNRSLVDESRSCKDCESGSLRMGVAHRWNEGDSLEDITALDSIPSFPKFGVDRWQHSPLMRLNNKRKHIAQPKKISEFGFAHWQILGTPDSIADLRL